MLSHRITAYYDLMRASLPLPPVYVLSSGSLPVGPLRAGDKKVPNLSCLSFPIVPSSVPRRLGDCIRLLLHRPLWPSPSSHKVGARMSTLGRFLRGSCNEAAKFALRYGPMELLALLRQGHLHSSFHLLGHPSGVSSITTRANNQFPRPDLHRLDKQPYRLHTKITKASDICAFKLRALRVLRGEYSSAQVKFQISLARTYFLPLTFWPVDRNLQRSTAATRLCSLFVPNYPDWIQARVYEMEPARAKELNSKDARPFYL